MQEEIAKLSTHEATIKRYVEDVNGAPSWDVLIKNWRCAFKQARTLVGTMPQSQNGLMFERWVVVGAFFGKERPRRGDRLDGLRSLRSRRPVGGQYNVVDVIPYDNERVYALVLTEAK